MKRREQKMINLNNLSMRVALGQFNELTDERWEYEDLLAWRRRAEEHGVRLITLENVPITFYDKIMLGQDGRERQLENMIATVRNIGRAGIPILGYHWMPNSVWRTDRAVPVRGGAISNSFDYSEAKERPLTHG